MSLRTDIIFAKALQSNAELMQMLPAGDVYNTAIQLPDVDADNAPVPYIILYFESLQNLDNTKDNPFEGDTDSVTIGIEICAQNREQLGEMTEMVRETVRTYFEEIDVDDADFDLVPQDYQFSASAINYDPDKPCFWQILTYQCDTNI